MATNDPNSGENRRRRYSRRGIRSRDIAGFVIGLFAFIGLGRVFKRQPSRSDMKHREDNVGQPAVYDTTPENPEIKHEPSDVNVRRIVLAGVILVVGAVIGHAALFGLFVFLESREARADTPPPPLAGERTPVAAPPLQADPEGDARQVLSEERERLESYGWVDQGAGVVHIPIDQAMERVIEQNLLPVRPEGALEDEDIPGLEEGRELESEGGQEIDGAPEQATDDALEPAIDATAETATEEPAQTPSATEEPIIEPPVQTQVAPTDQ